MKSLLHILILALVLALFSCVPTMHANNKYDKQGFQQGWWLIKTDTTSTQVVKYKKGFRDGVSKIVFSNGQYSICHYKHGKLNGTEKTYSNGGHLTRTRIYRNDSLIKETLQPESYIDWKKYRRM